MLLLENTYQYNQFNPPNQLFPNAATLNPFQGATSQAPFTSHIPFVGELLRYWKQNSSKRDFINITNNFISRLLQRGHFLEDLIPILRSAAATIDNAANNIQEQSIDLKSDEALYIHWQFHPKDINKSKIRQIYNTTLKGHDNFQHMRVAMARPKNLRDILCHTNLSMIPHHNVSDILHNLPSQTNNPKTQNR